MALTSRKPRPLTRDQDTFRDDRLFLVACDDTYAPLQYFGFFRLSRVKVHVVPTLNGSSSAAHVLDRLLEFDVQEGDERWMLLDTDHYAQGTHLKSLKQALQRARNNDVFVAMSKPCFELWLLLHYLSAEDVLGLKDASEVVAALRDALDGYSKVNLRADHYPLALLPRAMERARSLDEGAGAGDIPTRNASRVYRLWEAIVRGASEPQLPEVLRGLTIQGEPLPRGEGEDAAEAAEPAS